MIDDITIQKVKAAANIVDVVGDYVTLRRLGVNYKGLCPFHNEKTPSFIVTPARNICKCFGCGVGGDPISFIQKIENFSYVEAIRHLAKKYGIEIQEKEMTEEDRAAKSKRELQLNANKWLADHFVSNMNTDEGRAIGRSYFLQRGFREDIIKKFQLGYALENRYTYTSQSQKEGTYYQSLLDLGAIIQNDRGPFDRFAGRAMFPIHSISGQIVAFGGRAIKKTENTAKYQNSPENELYHKGDNLYGICIARNAIVKEQKCYIVEGYADVISMHQAGVENIVAPCGTALTTGQIKVLKRVLPAVGKSINGDKYVTMMYDGDKAGINAALKNGKLLLEEDLCVKVVVLPPEDDPDTFAQRNNSDVVHAYLKEHEQDYLHFKIDRLKADAAGDPMMQAGIIKDVAETIAVIPDPIKRDVYIQDCATRLGTSTAILADHVEKTIRQIETEKERKRKLQDQIPQQPQNPMPQPPMQTFQPMPMDGAHVDLTPAFDPSYTQPTQTYNQPAPQTSSPASITPSSDPYSDEQLRANPLHLAERTIIELLFRLGTKPFCKIKDEDANEERELSVAEYIEYDLHTDKVSLSHPVFHKMLKLAAEGIKANPSAEIFSIFQSSGNRDVEEAANSIVFLVDQSKERLSRRGISECEKDDMINIAKYVDDVLIRFKHDWIGARIDRLTTEIALAESSENDELRESLERELMKLYKSRAGLANAGGRTLSSSIPAFHKS